MLDLIKNNPYRMLGVYSTSSQKEIMGNIGKMKAFLRVGKNVSFPLDLTSILPEINRSEDNVKDAAAKLTLPAEQLQYAQFWFANISQFDDIACAKLVNGDVDGAINIWNKKDSASSLQNRIVCALIRQNYREVINCAELLYSNYADDFTKMILGNTATISSGNLANDFLTVLCDSVGAKKFLPYITKPLWKQYVGSKSTQPLIDNISNAITTAKTSKGGVTARYNAGIKLMNDTKEDLLQLKQFLSTNDLQYQMIVDKLGLEILQCGIDYYNGSGANDAAFKAMRLQKYALSIVVGKMAKDRCKENVDILDDIIAKLPPMQVFNEDKAIKEELRKYCQLPDKICHAITLLNNTKPYLQTIKSRLGVTNEYYLKLSTQVVGNALHNLIEEVNAMIKAVSDATSGADDYFKALAIKTVLTNTVQEAWKATLIMDTFDMESSFKTNRYNPQRASLKDLYDKLGVSTREPQPPTPTPPSTDNTPWGCIIPIIIIAIIALIAMCNS